MPTIGHGGAIRSTENKKFGLIRNNLLGKVVVPSLIGEAPFAASAAQTQFGRRVAYPKRPWVGKRRPMSSAIAAEGASLIKLIHYWKEDACCYRPECLKRNHENFPVAPCNIFGSA